MATLFDFAGGLVFHGVASPNGLVTVPATETWVVIVAVSAGINVGNSYGPGSVVNFNLSGDVVMVFSAVVINAL
jgi:hypothetical protein